MYEDTSKAIVVGVTGTIIYDGNNFSKIGLFSHSTKMSLLAGIYCMDDMDGNFLEQLDTMTVGDQTNTEIEDDTEFYSQEQCSSKDSCSFEDSEAIADSFVSGEQ